MGEEEQGGVAIWWETALSNSLTQCAANHKHAQRCGGQLREKRVGVLRVTRQERTGVGGLVGAGGQLTAHRYTPLALEKPSITTQYLVCVSVYVCVCVCVCARARVCV
jgi:hypothetical protein